ncbi:hypothetical protein Q7C_2043 [Methylophaga frappieri]|jgi:outer membrane lipoprotein-sorting protein|uniref:Lipoprotein n=1 Tax=Methylophaga frappieri (strain ATCC BAA-2434 / DSM 25690 / JAM7) TaxID=754477 RepID=I1YJT9_METFJ|nr:hypothetical protein [Methylophaga frappieri]AFJ03182.1 hypothetical protein Q7C_2043 [Methylophaga frappieri]
MHQSNTLMRMLSRFMLMAFIVGAMGMVSACEQQGPAEEAGEQVDEMLEESGDAIEDAADELEESTE